MYLIKIFFVSIKAMADFIDSSIDLAVCQFLLHYVQRLQLHSFEPSASSMRYSFPQTKNLLNLWAARNEFTTFETEISS